MKKNKKWLKEQLSKQINILHTTISSGNYVSSVKRAEILNLIDQLEEPEQDIDAAHDLLQEITTLSQEDFDLYWNCINDGVAIRDLEQEKVVIPQFVADFIEEVKPNFNIRAVFTLENDKHEQGQEWALNNPDVFARAWLGGFSVEKEKLYRVKFMECIEYTIFDRGEDDEIIEEGTSKWGTKLTEQEIKSIDERYWAFAEEVPD